MQFWPDRLQSPGARARRWFIVAILLLPMAMTASGLKAYYLTETWVCFKPHTWSQIASYPNNQIDADGSSPLECGGLTSLFLVAA